MMLFRVNTNLKATQFVQVEIEVTVLIKLLGVRM